MQQCHIKYIEINIWKVLQFVYHQHCHRNLEGIKIKEASTSLFGVCSGVIDDRSIRVITRFQDVAPRKYWQVSEYSGGFNEPEGNERLFPSCLHLLETAESRPVIVPRTQTIDETRGSESQGADNRRGMSSNHERDSRVHFKGINASPRVTNSDYVRLLSLTT